MAETTYLLCAATSIGAAILLLLRYWRLPTRLLFWSAIAFAGLALHNVLVAIDLVMFPQTDFAVYRAPVVAVAMLVLLGGLIWETS